MEKVDRRKFPRVKVFNPVHYDCVDKDGNLLVQNMGLALDISQNGILLLGEIFRANGYVHKHR